MSLALPMTPATSTQQRQFPCKQCGANLEFAPGQTVLKCPYCQAENEIAVAQQPIEELDFHSALADSSAADQTVETLTIKCVACGAESSLAPDVTAGKCPFCGAAIVAQAKSSKQIKPRSLLPFRITRDKAMNAFKTWVASLWFAPGDLTRYAEAGGIKGVYVPYWTYDFNTQSDYRGQRGDDYQETESYTEIENGQAVTKTRTVTKTRWWPVSGRVANTFDDVLVIASNSLPETITRKLEPWDLANLLPFSEEYLAGFVAESYQTGLEQGFEKAKTLMADTINTTICRDIGGDHQRIDWVNTGYYDITFKHILLPLWISAYLYRDRTFRFLVNARTGEVTGERPWSVWKIVAVVLSIVVFIAAVVVFVKTRG